MVSCVGTSKFYKGSSFDVVRVSRLQTQQITLEPKTRTYFPLTNLQIASLCSALRVSGNPMTGRDWTRVESTGMSTVVPHVHCVCTCGSVATKLIHTQYVALIDH